MQHSTYLQDLVAEVLGERKLALTVSEFAKVSGWSKSSIRRHVVAGETPALKVDGVYLINYLMLAYYIELPAEIEEEIFLEENNYGGH